MRSRWKCDAGVDGWQAGLLEGRFTANTSGTGGNPDETFVNSGTGGVKLTPAAGEMASTPPWGDYTGYVYTGQFYDSDGVHFLQQDPLLEKYYSIGSYNYCAGNPIDRIDFNGNLIIFINGFTFKKSEQGTANYWKKTDKNGDVDFATSVQAQLNDDNAMFRHGGTSTSANARIHDGEAQAAQDYQEIINTILGTDGIPKETIKIITHSMGAAFGKGYVRKLKELLVKNGHPEVLISLIADFDPYQAAKLSADSNIYTLQFTHQGIIADQRQNNLPDTNYRVDSQRDSHSIYSFFNDISRLQEGTYVYDGNNWILQN